VLLESEGDFGQHTSSRNSEVIHAGIYYPKDSLKARLCVAGKTQLYAFCNQFDIPHRKTGKYIVAANQHEEQLEELRLIGQANGVEDLELVNAATIRKSEPALQADCALNSPSTGIIDSHAYMQALLHQAQIHGLLFARHTLVESIDASTDGFELQTSITGQEKPYMFQCGALINCAGLSAQAVAAKIQARNPISIPPIHLCKGDYFFYRGKNPFQRLIYPLPESNTQGLGIHSTMDMSNQLRFGPDTTYVESIDYRIDESKKVRFVEAIGRYFPGISADNLLPAYSGIRPKLSGSGGPVADFVIQDGQESGISGLVQLFGIESPGLTASLAIGDHVCDLLS